MVDSMSLVKSISDIFDCGLQDDLLVLLFEANTEMQVSINTCYGSTENMTIPKLVAQGDLMAPLMAAVQVDTLCRKLEEEELVRKQEKQEGLLYRYPSHSCSRTDG